MSALANLKAATSLADLADLLGLPASALAYTLYKISPDQKYTTFAVPKKSGGARQIAAPIKRLKTCQKSLSKLLVQCRLEIEATTPRKLVSHGFRKEGSILTNAAQHRSRRYVLNLDIQDFFPSINFGRVRGFFLTNRNFALNDRVATIVAQLACHSNSLPQGSPCSPIISDLIAHLLDVRLARLARLHKCTYSRYADDLTISTNKEVFPPTLAYQLEEGSSAWIVGEDLLYEVERAGFSVNHKKTRMQYRGSRQVVTGLTVNKKVNISADYYRSARTMCHSLFVSGSYFNPANGHAPGAPPTPGKLAALEGIVRHIYFVKQHEALRSQPPRYGKTHPGSEKKEPIPKHDERHGIDLLYSRLVFYKRFVAPAKPLVLTEGGTDNIYLRAAIKRLPAYDGVLSTTANGKRVLGVDFLKHTRITRILLGLDGGASYFPDFMNSYNERVSEFKHTPLQHPVVIVVDNDDGAKGVFGFLKNKKSVIDHTTTADFYPVSRNLYVVKTPEIGPKSQIEDLFDAPTLAKPLNGKTFNKTNDADTATEYGKAHFAEYIVAPNANKIDFSGFKPLLDRIVATIQYHQRVVAAGVV